MTYTTTATREALNGLNLPSGIQGTLFQVTITPIDKDDYTGFHDLMGMAGRELDLDTIRGERLREAANRYECGS